MLFERILFADFQPLDLTLKYRAAERGGVAEKRDYAAALLRTMDRLRARPALKQQPLFELDGFSSPSFRLEYARVQREIYGLAMNDGERALSSGEYRQAKGCYTDAESAARALLQNNAGWTLRPRIEALNPYLLTSHLLSALAFRLSSMHLFSPTTKAGVAAASRAYQYMELSERLWPGKDRSSKLLSSYHHSKAGLIHAGEGDFESVYNHTLRAKELHTTPHLLSDLEELEKLNTVHFVQYTQPPDPPHLALHEVKLTQHSSPKEAPEKKL